MERDPFYSTHSAHTYEKKKDGSRSIAFQLGMFENSKFEIQI